MGLGSRKAGKRGELKSHLELVNIGEAPTCGDFTSDRERGRKE